MKGYSRAVLMLFISIILIICISHVSSSVNSHLSTVHTTSSSSSNPMLLSFSIKSLSSSIQSHMFYLYGHITFNDASNGIFKTTDTIQLVLPSHLVFPYSSQVTITFLDTTTDTPVADVILALPRHTEFTQVSTLKWNRSPVESNKSYNIRICIDFGDRAVPPVLIGEDLVSEIQLKYQTGIIEAISTPTSLHVHNDLSESIWISATCTTLDPQQCYQAGYDIYIRSLTSDLDVIKYTAIGSSELQAKSQQVTEVLQNATFKDNTNYQFNASVELVCFVNGSIISGTIEYVRSTRTYMHVLPYNYLKGHDYTIRCYNSSLMTNPSISPRDNNTMFEISGEITESSSSSDVPIRRKYTSVRSLVWEYDQYHALVLTRNSPISNKIRPYYFTTFSLFNTGDGSITPNNMKLWFKISGIPVASIDVYVNYTYDISTAPIAVAFNVKPNPIGVLPHIDFTPFLSRSQSHRITLRVKTAGFSPSSSSLHHLNNLRVNPSTVQFKMDYSFLNSDKSSITRYVISDAPVIQTLSAQPYIYETVEPHDGPKNLPMLLDIMPHRPFISPTIRLFFSHNDLQFSITKPTQMECHFDNISLPPIQLDLDSFGSNMQLEWKLDGLYIPATVKQFYCTTDHLVWSSSTPAQVALEIISQNDDATGNMTSYIIDLTIMSKP